MNTNLWGGLIWSLLNDVAVVGDKLHGLIDESSRNLFIQFFMLMRFLLPCIHCRTSYTQYTTETPPTFPLIPWIYAIHNKVNKKLDKPIPFEENIFRRRTIVYTSFGSTNNLYDILVILAFNHDKVEKIKPYQLFMRHLKWVFPLLVKYKNYDPYLADLLTSYKPKYVTSRLPMLKWLTKYNPLELTYEQLITTYGEVIAYKNKEEMEAVCGPLSIGEDPHFK